MQEWSLGMLVLIALGWGARHALDTDHLMTLAGLSQQFSPRPSLLNPFLGFCLLWSLGHTVILLLIGILVLVLDMAIPYRLSQYAEYGCAFLLLCLGLWLIFTRPGVSAKHAPARQSRLRVKSKHSALAVGSLHGLSGTAPLLALLPLTHDASPWYGVLYLVCFGLGVSLGMAIFAGCLNFGYLQLIKTNTLFQSSRLFIGIGGAVYGSIMLMGVG